MRARIEGAEIDGTPEEIAELLAAIRGAANVRVETASKSVITNPEAESSEGDEDITAQFAYRALRRLPLSVSQKAFLLALKRAHPDWVRASEIQNSMSWSGVQFGGVLGGLGRRITATKGYRTGFALWDWKWDDDEGEYAYRLPDAVSAAIDRMEL